MISTYSGSPTTGTTHRLSQQRSSRETGLAHAPCLAFSLAFSLTLFLALGPIATAPAHAGGLYTNEFSTTVQANAGAGRGAWAPDASSSLHNPATMTERDEHSFASGFSVAFANVHFDTDSSSPGGTGNGGNQAGIAPIASFSYVHKVSDRVRFGLSFFSISGSILNPSNDWGGRFEVTKISLLTISIAPNLAVRVTDWLSIGGGPVANYGSLNWDLKAQFPPVPPGSESYVRLNDLDDWQPSGRVGILLKPTKTTALSIYYNSKTDYKLSGHIDGPIGLSRSLKADLPMAQFIEVSGYWQTTEKLALLAIFNWEDWSEANKLSIDLGALPSTNAATGFKDTFKVGIGANYQLADDWLLQTGLTYDTSALQNKNRTAALPIDDQIRFALGAQHALTDSTSLGLSFVYLNLGQGEIRQSTLRGDYDRNHAFIFGLTVAFNKLPWNGKLTYPGSGG